jgi:dTDP-4-amino-4,6-dideoxygalactose transaminase
MSDKTSPIPLIDLGAQRRAIAADIDAAVARVIAHGAFILGPEVAALERALAGRSGAAHAVTCANGTDAITLILMAWGIGPGDAAICPAFTFTATPEAPALLGATPVLADIDPSTFNLDPAGIAPAAAHARSLGLSPKVVIAADLFGLPADYAAIEAAAAREGLLVLADAAQSFGAHAHGRRVGTFGAATAVSFFPSKPLGCYGDGGAVLTSDSETATTIESLRAHGKGADKYENVRIGMNSRLDTIQAAILIEKLSIFDDEIAKRQTVAARYGEGLRGVVLVPEVPADHRSVWAQYSIRVPGGRRDGLMAALKSQGIASAVYYPTPLHKQTAYRDFPVAPGGVPISEAVSADVLSLPMHPYLDTATQDRVIDAVRRFLGA